MAWILQVVQSLPISSNEILLPWDFTSNEVLLYIAPTLPIAPKYIHAGWLKQLILIDGLLVKATREFKRLPLGYSYLELNNSNQYELSFKCFDYLGQLDMIAYENI